ncbi:uncharacterized protein LAESUDRAFT_721945 [Laetiporus sulphureus 93-53]|uniref:Conserved oligomeric Golgi complex subunit 7 n=1 Tax=Laetiporus sulphureus 93-53 TaxID=1314785 RepID=A0A165GMP4_9APHY|nr:uncharacterized protein LAESUDRAFT_721945 [Laetiporus sulphureus 93-53]KZT10561.1 hypothetical protein LAESUDRAFT_721945 [Laetiporus sulphureus 93-53]
MEATGIDSSNAKHLELPLNLLNSLESSTDAISWINEVLEPRQEGSENEADLIELDKRISSLTGTLEIASEDTSAEVERLIDDISRGAARLTYDLHFMRDGALSLQAVLQNVESKSKASVAAETNAALDRLHFLDTVKRNMEAAREVLREAESWGTLESDVTSLLGEKSYEKAAERLSEANKSMAVFENTPEYESRRTLMVSLQNQLEAALSSALVAAVGSQDVAVCRNYFAIFSNIQREAEFRNYYYGSRRASLVEAWRDARLTDCDGTTDGGQTFASFLPTFFTLSLSILQIERTSIPAIFPDPQQTLSTLISSTLSALQPSFSQRLASVSTYYGAVALRELIAAYGATQEFAAAVEKIFEKVGYSAMHSPAVGIENDSPRVHPRRRSSARMSISISRRMSVHRLSSSNITLSQTSNRSGSPGALPTLEWDTDLFAPFIDFQGDYQSLERRMLDEALAAAMRTTLKASGGADRARVLRERSVDIFGAAEEAITHCSVFTHGYGAEGLVQALDYFISAFAEASRAEITAEKSAGGMSANELTEAKSEDDLADLDYTAEDWAEIQSLLHLLEAVRAVTDRTSAFEAKLRASLVQISQAFPATREDPSNVTAYGENTTRGAMQLLMQSGLNSAALHTLLDIVEPESQTQLAPNVPPSPDARRGSSVSPVPSHSSQPPVLVAARIAMSQLALTCQVALQETILGPLNAYLASYASLSLWVQDQLSKRSAGASAGGATSAVHVPTFSLSPSPTMARVAEGLLSLPRLFEVYADDDALAVSLETLPHISKRFLSAVAEPVAPSPTPSHTMPELKSRRSSSLALLPGQITGMQAQVQAQNISEMHFSPEAVTAAWLTSLTRTLLANLTRTVLPRIPRLNTAGAAQLATDLSWLANIVEALNVEWPPLTRWRKWVEETDTEGKRKIQEGEEAMGESGDVLDAEKEKSAENEEEEQDEDEKDSEQQIRQIIARLRGWST